MNDMAMFLIAQSVIIIGAIVATYVRTSVSIAVLQSNTEDLKKDHSGLSAKVDGISRAVGRLEGKVHSQ